jgi:S-adenosylmethionine-diacylgycerolhomoserine-N-methlytransferase
MEHLERYYRFQSLIYDATRWLFLFGRAGILDRLAEASSSPHHIVEIGCGTGHNLCGLARRFRGARITGIDLSPHMLVIARRKTVRFDDRVVLRQAIQRDRLEAGCDAVLFSYSLSMMNPGWEGVLDSVIHALVPGGVLAAVDFHATPVGVFRAHMEQHHVRMEGHLLPALEARLRAESATVRSAYGGLWNWFEFLGRKPSQ